MISYNMTRSQIENIGKSSTTGKDLAIVLGGIHLYTNKEEQSVGQWLSNDGYWESWVTSWMTKNIKPGYTCLDIGANYGYYTRLMEKLSGHNGQVYAFEANPELNDLILKSIKDYPGQNNAKVECYPIALSNKKGEVELSISSQYIGGSTIVFGSDLPSNIEKSLWDRKMMVNSDILDNFDLGHINLIKMDIEGAEFLAWQGMQKTLEKTDLIVMELGSYSPKEFIEDIYKRYSVTYINDSGNEDYISKEEIYHLNDLVMAVLRKR